MLIIHVVGGLGNQLYCYAMYCLQKSLSKEVKLDIGDYEEGAREPEKRPLELLELCKEKPKICTKKERESLTDDSKAFFSRVKRKLVGQKAHIFQEKEEYDEEVFTLENVYMDGYWNCEKYYEKIIDQLQEKIEFPPSKNEQNRIYAKKIQTENACAIHLRRSDYLDPSCIDRYRDICTSAYYNAALAYVEKLEENLTYYVFSDDIVYAKAYFQTRKNVTVVDWNQGKDSMYDCMLMSKCKYHICANSTFSMWGARLSVREDKVMIRPLKHDNYQKQSPEEMKDQWKKWILIDAQGKVYDQ